MPAVLEWDIGISMLSQYDEDDFLVSQIDAEGEENSGVHPYEQHHPYGFMGRQLDPVVDGKGVPDPTTANQMLFGLEGGKGHNLALENPSVVKKLPLLKKGESIQYGAKGQFLRCMEDGSIGVWAPANDGSVDFSGTLGPDGIFFAGRWGTFELSDNGFHVKHSSGARIDLGAMGGLPAPLSALGSYCQLTAASVDLTGTAVMAGPGDGPHVSAVGSQTLAFLLAGVAAALTALNAAIATATLPSGITPANISAAAAAVGPAAAALAAAIVTPGFATNLKATV